MEHTPIRPGRHHLRVVSVAELGPSMRRITVAAPTLTALPLRPAQDVGLVFADDSGREIRRRYTIRRADRSAGTIDLEGILHGHGPGAQWFASVTVGDEIEAVGPRGKIELVPAAWHLFVGDESGLPAFAELLGALVRPSIALAIIEIDDARHEQPLELPSDAEVRWVHRDGQPPGRAELLTMAIRSARFPVGTGRAVLLGESRTVVALRAELAGRGIAGRGLFLKGYWNYLSR